MKRIILSIISLTISLTTTAQRGFDVKKHDTGAAPTLEKSFIEISGKSQRSGSLLLAKPDVMKNVKQAISYKVSKDPETGQVIMIENLSNFTEGQNLRKPAATLAVEFFENVKEILEVNEPTAEFKHLSTSADELGISHLTYTQVYKGVPIYGSEVVIHAANGAVKTLNGRPIATPNGLNVKPKFSKEEAINLGLAELSKFVFMQDPQEVNSLVQIKNNASLKIYLHHDKPVLAYEMTLRPNALERWEMFVDAHTGEVLDKYNNTCTLDGVINASAKDLNGVSSTFRVLQQGANYFMIDATKDMFNSTRSNLPDNPVGAIWTIDAQNSRSDGKMNFAHVTSTNPNSWNATAVSAHINASKCFDYYRTTFGRNSLNGSGGNIVSVINITDEDGAGMDNAYWNGEFMGYGNGNVAFKPLAGALDVAGHEMTHGVIQNTVNLEYKGQSGALNESFADIFGAMIDRDDWVLGEDVVVARYFPSGALRSLSNPNQGGRNDNGYQPKTMAQYVNLPITAEGDYGGVHVNSGIPNYAFYLFATAGSMSKEKAERVYYRVLNEKYLTRISKFVDLRLAVIQATKDLYGDGAEVAAAKSAFDQVGILDPNAGGQAPTETEEIIPVNTGSQFVVVYEPSSGNMYNGSLTGSGGFSTIANGIGCLRKPSVSDDGSLLFFVGKDNNIYGVDLTVANPKAQNITNDNAWSNAAISKDGRKLAGILKSEQPKIYVFDLEKQTQAVFDLYNPTYTAGVSTGEVQYPDSFELDYSGEYIIYDAFNSVDGIFGGIEYWDVGVINVWNSSTNTFGTGTIEKIFTDLEEGDNIGNPAIAKTNPNVIAFDYLDSVNDKIYVIGLNLITGEIAGIVENTTIGFPDYTVDDKALSFTGEDPSVGEVVKIIAVDQTRINPQGAARRYFDGGEDKWAVFYAKGERQLPTKVSQTINFAGINAQLPGSTVTLSATASSGLGIIYSVVSGSATVNGNTLVCGSQPGVVIVRATQTGNDGYEAAFAEQSFCIVPGAPSLSYDGTNLLVNGNSALYQYYINGNPLGGQTSANKLFADRNGTYTVTAITQDGCESAASAGVFIQRVLSTNPSNLALKVYPSPATEYVEVDLLKEEQVLSIDIMDATGKLLLQDSMSKIDVSQLAAGLYLLDVKTNRRSGVLKFVK